MAKIFITGSSGYIGGDALAALLEKHSTLEPHITALVRSSDKGALIAKKYPQIKLVYGSLDDVKLVAQQSAAADLVLHFADADHKIAAQAIVDGLAERTAKNLPGYLIHTSGTGILTYPDLRAKRFGSVATEEFSDSDTGISTLVSLPDDALHRDVDKIVLAASGRGVTTAIVAPPNISGRGRGPANQRSIQWPWLIEEGLKRKKIFQVGEGKNQWHYVHVQDLSNVYLALTEAALDRIAGGTGGKSTWNQQGYYLAATSPFVWSDVSKIIAEESKKLGLLDSSEVESLDAAAIDAIKPYGSVLWGSNSLGTAVRAKELLGWEPKYKDWQAVVRETVEDEAHLLGLIKTHAQKAAGV